MTPLPTDAEGFDCLPCGCKMKTTTAAGTPTFVYKPCALDCEFYEFVKRESGKQGKPIHTVDMRERDGGPIL